MRFDLNKEKYLQRINLENWLCLTVFLLPAYLIKITVFVFPTNLLEVMIGIGFFWWLLDEQYGVSFRGIWLKYKIYFLPISLIFFGLIVGTFLQGNFYSGLGIIKGWFVFPLVFLFISAEILDNQKTKKLFQCFYLSALVVATVALVYWFFGQVTFDDRLRAIFNSPNYLAMYLSPAIVIGAVLFRENKKYYSLSLTLILVVVFLTYSLSAWIAVAISMLVILFLAREVDRKIIFITGLVLISCVPLLMLGLKIEKAENFSVSSGRSSIVSRLMIWRTTEKLIQDNIVWGIGPGNFQNKYLEYQKFYPPYLEWAVPHPHNIFLSFWLYSGLFGLSGFLLLLGIFFREFFVKQKGALKFMALGIMLIILFQGLLDTTYFKNDLAVIFWLAYLGMMKRL